VLHSTYGPYIKLTKLGAQSVVPVSGKVNSNTPRSTVLTEKVRGPQIEKKFAAIYVTKIIITVSTKARQLQLP
jgi:hypothetical protein